MPRRDHWDTFFDPPRILNRLGFDRVEGAAVDVGAGYGTFTLATVRCTDREVAAIGIEQTLLDNLVAKMRDGTGLPDGSAGIVLLFNLLHCEQPFGLIAEAQRTLRPAGRVGIVHSRSDIPTPRGRDLSIRPTPGQRAVWLRDAGLELAVRPRLLPPHHFGLVGRKTDREPPAWMPQEMA